MPSWQDSLIIGMGLLKSIRADNITASPTAVALGVYPLRQSAIAFQPLVTSGTLERATFAWIRPTANVHLSVEPVVSTTGPRSAVLASGQEYPFPLHPNVDTLFFLDAQGGNNAVYVRWVSGR